MYPDVYKQFFRSYPVSQLDASEEKRRAANFGGKICLPPSALSKLMTLRISYPMLFELRSSDAKSPSAETRRRTTHAGVLEFIAPEGRAYLPEWMMQTLGLKPGSLVEIRSTSLELGTFVKLEPQSVEFLDITDPKAVLENSLRNFSALTAGDVFQIDYNDSIYGIKVLEVQPETDKDSICVVETDLSVDFAPPVGYEEPVKRPKIGSHGTGVGTAPQSETAKAYESIVKSHTAPPGGMRLNGKEVKVEEPPVDATIYKNRDAPPLVLPEGQLFFGFPVLPVDATNDNDEEPVFRGGQTLRKK